MANITNSNDTLRFKLNKGQNFDSNADQDEIKNNTRLRPREAEQITEPVSQVASEHMNVIADLREAGLTRSTGVEFKTLEYDKTNDADEAKEAMEFTQTGDNQHPDYKTTVFANPIMYSQLNIGRRDLEASRQRGQALDTTGVENGTEAIMEKAEDLVFNGSASQINDTSNPGILDSSVTQSQTLSNNWTSSNGTPVDDIIQAVGSLYENNVSGNRMVYIPNNYWKEIQKDYKPSTSSSKTIRERILEIEGVQGIKSSFKVPSDTVLVVTMKRKYAHLAMGQGVTVTDVSPDHDKADLQLYLWANMTPIVRTDYNDTAGIVKIS